MSVGITVQGRLLRCACVTENELRVPSRAPDLESGRHAKIDMMYESVNQVRTGLYMLGLTL